MSIAITGAAGQLGRLVIDALLRTTPPDQIIALVRTPEKAADLAGRGVEIRPFDYDVPEGLATSLAGVGRLLLISGNDMGHRVPQQRSVIAAAEAAEVGFLAYTSVLHADSANTLPVAPDHRETEELLARAPFPVALLRNGWYSENYLSVAQQAAETGTLLTSAGEGRVASAARADYADAAAVVLTSEVPTRATYELEGETAWTQEDLAAAIADVSGRPIELRSVSADEHRAALLDAGVPEAAADFLVSTDTAIAQGELASDDTDTLSRLIGRRTTSLRDVLAAAFTEA